MLQVLAAGFDDSPGERRHHRGQADAGQLAAVHAGVIQQAGKLQAVFIGHALVVGRQAPVPAELLLVVQPEGDIGIADVDGQKHGKSPLFGER